MNIDDFLGIDEPKWGSRVEKEIHRRIRLSVAAYSYEVLNESIMSDSEFDILCKEIDTDIKTGNKKLDTFFKTKFDPSTGQWIHSHPELDGIKKIYEQYYRS